MKQKFHVLALAKPQKNAVNSFSFTMMLMLLIFTANINAQTTSPISCNTGTLTNSNGYYGGFEAGGTNGINNFTAVAASTEYTYGEGQREYQILSNTDGQSGYRPLLPHSGNFFLTSHTASSNPDLKLWYKTLSVNPGQQLQICAWIANLKVNPVGGFQMSIVINTGSNKTVIASKTAPTNSWVQMCGTYTVPAGVTSIEVEVEDPNPSSNGSSHFIAIDDICITDMVASTNPDCNSTLLNMSVLGNTATNDYVPSGTAYGNSPALMLSPAGSVATISMNSNGTYSFTANTMGLYTYNVPVCAPGQSEPCAPTKLFITVLGASINTNAPVANVDFTITKFNTAVTLKTLQNDAAGNVSHSLVPSSVVVSSEPLHGIASVNATTGDISYTPTPGFTGADTLTYQVCDNQSPAKCATAIQIITVKHSGTTTNTTTAVDDFRIASVNMPASGNVKTNGADAEGNTQTVTAQTTTMTGKGTLVLSADGSYTFTPVNGFIGPMDFIYTTCDNGIPQACAAATLHILVKPAIISIVLPITLLDFTAAKQNNVVELNWQTSSEQNSSHFDVEFSMDGSKFKNIGRVNATGNSNTIKGYSSTHVAPVNGVNYYRLKLIDADGTFKYSPVRTVKFGTTTSINIMPNPTVDRVYITSNEGGILQSVGLYSINGKLLQSVNNFALGNSIDLSNYGASIYILKLVDKNGNTEVVRVVKK